MTTPSFPTLDQTELLQLALNASRTNDAGNAIVYLKEAVSRVDATPQAHFLLGSEYAQIGMYDRAVSEMEAAIALDPTFSIARFQLGLLFLSSGVAERASEILAPLEELGSKNALAQFGRGLQHLIRDEFTDAIQCLQHGIALNTNNPALSADMQKIVDEINRLPPETMQKKTGPESSDDDAAHHIFISAYTGKGIN